MYVSIDGNKLTLLLLIGEKSILDVLIPFDFIIRAVGNYKTRYITSLCNFEILDSMKLMLPSVNIFHGGLKPEI